MTCDRTNRRRFLLGTTATLVAMAGCAGGDDDAVDDAVDDAADDAVDDAADDPDGGDDAGDADDGPGEPAVFEVRDLDPRDVSLTVGEMFETSAEVDNVGGTADTAEVQFRLDGETVDSDALDLAGGETATVTFEVATDGLDGGEYVHAVRTPDDEQTGTLVLEAPRMVGDDELETVEEGHPAYAAWVDREAFVSTTDYVEAAAVDAYDPLFGEDLFQDQEPDYSELFEDVEGLAEILPLQTSAFIVIVVAFLGLEFPFVEDIELPVEFEEEEAVEEPVMALERVTFVDETVVFGGTVDRDALEAREDVKELESHAGFTVYRSEPEFGDPSPFAASDERVVLPDPDEIGAQDFEGMVEELKSTLDGVEAGVEIADADVDWLVERCGDGVFVLGGFGDEVDDAGDEFEEIPGWDVEEAALQAFSRGLEGVTGILMAADTHDEGRVTRSGFAFETAADIPDEGFADAVTTGAERRNVLVEGNRVLVEAFW